MSKAFVREDYFSEDVPPPRNFPTVPAGTKNYLTARGADRLRDELAELVRKRSGLTALITDSEIRRSVQEIDRRIRHVQESLRTAEIVSPASDSADVVRFGATVTVRDSRGIDARYRIVGVDETNLDRGDVSWLSPLAQALLNARTDQRIRLKAPRREEELEIVEIAYD